MPSTEGMARTITGDVVTNTATATVGTKRCETSLDADNGNRGEDNVQNAHVSLDGVEKV